jgi:hypothetical protein
MMFAWFRTGVPRRSALFDVSVIPTLSEAEGEESVSPAVHLP